MRVELRAIEEAEPGEKWRRLWCEFWPQYERWFSREGDHARPLYLTSVRALKQHLPELLGHYEQLVELAGGSDAAARFLSLYCPPPYLSGCSQAAWSRGDPLLVRNYDYTPRLWEGLILHTRWIQPVIAMSDCLWGVLDGMNASGLAASLAFGGRRAVGPGFGIPLVLRYVLETCQTTAEAIAVLRRVPVHMAYNVTLVDRSGEIATVQVAPDHPPVVTRRPFATNHQRAQTDWPQFVHATASLARERILARHLADPAESEARLVERFLQPPLLTLGHSQGWGTLYTALYRTRSGRVEYLWPGRSLEQSFESFRECALELSFPQVPGTGLAS